MKMKKCTIAVLVLFLMNILIPCQVFAQQAVSVMTLSNGTNVSMTSAQLSALASQPGITISQAPFVAATEIAVPVPASLGGGFIVGEPAALAAGMNATGITTGATAASVAGATTATGAIAAGAGVAGAAAATGIGAGTIAIGAGVAAAAAAAAVGLSGGGGGGGTTLPPATTTTHH